MNQQAKNDQNEKPNFVFRRHENGSWQPTCMIPGEAQLELAPKVYEPRMFEEGMSIKLGLFEVEAVKPPSKVYGDVLKHVDRYFRTYERRNDNVGIMLLGQKGSGKTTTSRCATTTALQLGMPVISVTQLLPGEALVFLMSSISQNCAVIFDEVDKTYGKIETDPQTHAKDYKHQTELLRILDGSVGGGKKLFFLIGNQAENISPYLINRPSRIRYTRMFNLLPLDVLLPYVRDNLKDCTDLQLLHFKKYRHYAGGELNFDMVQGLVEEMNAFKISLFEAATEMFAMVPLSGTIRYLVETKLADGTITDMDALEGAFGHGGNFQTNIQGERSNSPPVMVLSDEDFKGFKDFGPDFDLLYEKDGVSYTLCVEHGDPGKKSDKTSLSLFDSAMTEVQRRLVVVRDKRWERDREHQKQEDEIIAAARAQRKNLGETSEQAEGVDPANPARMGYMATKALREAGKTPRGGYESYVDEFGNNIPTSWDSRMNASSSVMLSTKHHDGSGNPPPPIEETGHNDRPG